MLHSFQPVSGDGEYPETGLTWDHSGNLIGVTPSGGSNRPSACGGNCGTVFQLSLPSTPGGAWTETILQNFKWGQGVEPLAIPVVAANGTLYGTTYSGGLGGEGVIYRLTPPATSSGTLFEFIPPAVVGGARTENILYNFGSFTGDAGDPAANIIFDSAGNIYGTTTAGGAENGGAVFQLTPPASSDGNWTETVLHSFHDENENDGVLPSGGTDLRQERRSLWCHPNWRGRRGGYSERRY